MKVIKTNNICKYIDKVGRKQTVNDLKKDKGLFKSLLKQTIDLPSEYNLSARLYFVYHNLTIKDITCKKKGCNNLTKYCQWSKGFYKYCSKQCSCSSMVTSSKTKKTLLLKYGVDNPMKNKNIKNKAEVTNLKKYGVPHAIQNKDIKNKIKATCLDKYGINNHMTDSVKQKIRKTCLDKYGVDNPMKNKDIKNKVKTTNLNKYGVKHNFQIPSYLEKRKLNNRIEYYPILVKQLKEKHIKLLTPLKEYLKGSSLKLKCTRCKQKFNSTITHSQNIHCHYCSNRSIIEEDLKLYLKNLGVNIIPNKYFFKNGKRYEADFFLPDFNLVIEMNGDYWHSDLIKSKNYHKDKTDFFKELGIEVIHIFECEWIHKQFIVKSIIRNRLNLNKKRIFARKCIINTISNKEYKSFLDNNHIQGFAVAKYRLGLFYNRELVALMSFGKSRFSKNEFELIRYCVRKRTSIIGGFQKLFKNACKLYCFKQIVSYCDLRYFTGNSYISSGFKVIKNTKPNYFYVKDTKMESRWKYQKHKLKKLIYYDKNLSEYKNMLNNGFFRIWDCGNLKLIYNYR